MKIALLQGRYVTGKVRENARRLVERTLEATRAGALLCVAPELALSGPNPRDLLLTPDFVTECYTVLQDMAAELASMDQSDMGNYIVGGPALLLGAPVPNPAPLGQPAHNCAVLLHEGKVRIISRKVLLSHHDGLQERRYFERGMHSGTLDFSGWRFAVFMAEDMSNMPDFGAGRRLNDHNPVAECMASGADAMICLSSLFYSPKAAARQENLLAAASSFYRVPVLYVNHSGGCGARVFTGSSLAYGTDGALFARSRPFKEDTLYVNIATMKSTVAVACTDLERLWNCLVTGLKDYAADANQRSAVVGLSGGMDSSLVAALAVEAFGPDNVLGLIMPSPYSSGESEADAAALAHNLGIQTHRIPIAALMHAYERSLTDVFSGPPTGVTEENIQARIRGNILMAFSNNFGGLVLCTGNKSESAMGYCTLYGDAAGALAPIGDIYKTRTYALAEYCNQKYNREIIPRSVFVKAPSAELRPGQKDSDSLPPYDVLDAILEKLIEGNMGPRHIVAQGADKATVERVVRLLFAAEFKREQMPFAIQVSDRPFGAGWHMPVNTLWEG